MGIPVFHMEAGNRCYDDRVPEEVNRRVIDHASDVLLPYTERSRANLLREGIAGERIFVTGNPIKEVLDHYAPKIASSHVMEGLGLERGGYFLVTLHRAENVDGSRLDVHRCALSSP
jgi:UDP-N-acetylglucosamine 2-epimerase (non-hydrolysing)